MHLARRSQTREVLQALADLLRQSRNLKVVDSSVVYQVDIRLRYIVSQTGDEVKTGI